MDALVRDYPSTALRTSGLAVGLPEGQMGNSEVGHTNLGAGRIVYQDLVRINRAIEDGSFFQNPALLEAVPQGQGGAAARSTSWGSSPTAACTATRSTCTRCSSWPGARGSAKVFVHAFLDGRDTPPKSGLGYVRGAREAA